VSSNTVSVDGVAVPNDHPAGRPVSYRFRGGRLEWVHSNGTTSGPGAIASSSGNGSGSGSHDGGSGNGEGGRPPADPRFFSADTSTPFSPVASNLVAVDGKAVPKGAVRPIGYRFGLNREIVWVYRNASEFPGAQQAPPGNGEKEKKKEAPPSGPVANGQVFIVSGKTCIPCRHLKAFLAEAGIAFTELDVGDDWSRFTQVRGDAGLPILFVSAPPPATSSADIWPFAQRRTFGGNLNVLNEDQTPNEANRAAIQSWINRLIPQTP
jgi:hypothetical protein